MVSFTGSTVVGRGVMAAASATVKRVFLELGGKSAFIVLDDADLAMACLIAGYTVCSHAGQGCAITTRLLVPESTISSSSSQLALLPPHHQPSHHQTLPPPPPPVASHQLLLLHASRASVDPVSGFYLREAPDLWPVNILDEGVMDDLREKNWGRAVARLRDLIEQAVSAYGVATALVTCSALRPEQMAAIRAGSSVRTIKIDEPMLEQAAGSFAGSIGLVATFPATVETSVAWLRHFRPGAEVEIVCDAEALQALLRGEREEHDRRLLAAAGEMASRGVGGIVLAQVSMARLTGEIRWRTGLEVFESLTTSLARVRGWGA